MHATPPSDTVQYLNDLADMLSSRGWAATVRGREQRPVLWVRNPVAADLNETILCRPQPNGGLAYTWSWGEVIAPVAETGAVADRIMHVLRCLEPES